MTSTETVMTPAASYLPLFCVAARERHPRPPVEARAEQEHTRGAGEPPATHPTLGRYWALA